MSVILAAILFTAGPAPSALPPTGPAPTEATTLVDVMAALGDRCWVVNDEGLRVDDAALSRLTGEIEVECLVEEDAASAEDFI